jgi:hypothetical protein
MFAISSQFMPVRLSAWFGSSAVDFTPVADFEDLDGPRIVVDAVNDTVGSLPDAEPVVVPRKLLGSRRARVAAESLNPLNDTLPIDFAGDRYDLFGRGPFDAEAISCHGAEAR